MEIAFSSNKYFWLYIKFYIVLNTFYHYALLSRYRYYLDYAFVINVFTYDSIENFFCVQKHLTIRIMVETHIIELSRNIVLFFLLLQSVIESP